MPADSVAYAATSHEFEQHLTMQEHLSAETELT